MSGRCGHLRPLLPPPNPLQILSSCCHCQQRHKNASFRRVSTGNGMSEHQRDIVVRFPTNPFQSLLAVQLKLPTLPPSYQPPPASPPRSVTQLQQKMLSETPATSITWSQSSNLHHFPLSRGTLGNRKLSSALEDIATGRHITVAEFLCLNVRKKTAL